MSLDKINNIIDNLTLDFLTLIEQQIQENVDLELGIKDGNYHLAKARYIMGHRNVSSLQLPNEESPETTAVIQVKENEMLNGLDDKFSVDVNAEALKKGRKSEDNTCINPLKWFGVLVPQELKYAQSKYQHATVHAVNCANIKLKIEDISNKLLFLLNFKDDLVSKSE